MLSFDTTPRNMPSWSSTGSSCRPSADRVSLAFSSESPSRTESSSLVMAADAVALPSTSNAIDSCCWPLAALSLSTNRWMSPAVSTPTISLLPPCARQSYTPAVGVMSADGGEMTTAVSVSSLSISCDASRRGVEGVRATTRGTRPASTGMSSRTPLISFAGSDRGSVSSTSSSSSSIIRSGSSFSPLTADTAAGSGASTVLAGACGCATWPAVSVVGGTAGRGGSGTWGAGGGGTGIGVGRGFVRIWSMYLLGLSASSARRLPSPADAPAGSTMS
mmetsp:Transcript_54059/g.135959  ORF Transcript_54059/g.135959 Transcript_54059/m.135959 type:complete len:276 (-) Transcript_54059:1621-2448(-)